MQYKAGERNRAEYGKVAIRDQVEQFGTGRKCRLCKKPLTTFNSGAECFSHSVTKMEMFYG